MKTGPVCPKLFYANQGTFSITANDEQGNSNNLNNNQKDTINRVLNHYAIHNAQWLSQLTHMEDPWQLARINVPSGISSNNIISKESIAMYYGGL